MENNISRSLDLVYLGLGEGGGRLASASEVMGFAINTTKTDLDGLAIPENHKLLLSTGGTGRDPNVIRDEFSRSVKFQKDLDDFINKNLLHCDIVIATIGGGGGSGSGLAIPVIKALLSKGIKVGAIYTLPEDFQDTIVHKNALGIYQQIYSELAINGDISPLILVDNEFIRRKFNVSIDKAYPIMNSFIISMLESFNIFSTYKSEIMSAIDKNDFLRLLNTGGCTTMQHVVIGDLKEIESAIEALNTDIFLGDGYDLTTAKTAGIIVIGSDKIFSNPLSTKFIDKIFDRFRMALDEPQLIFRGVYRGRHDDKLEIRSMVSGLSFPKSKFDELFDRTRKGVNRALRKQNRLDTIGYDLDGASALDNNFSNERKRRTNSSTGETELSKEKVRKVPCDNCILDEGGSSTGKYNGSGKSPFENSICPVCKNSGLK